MRYRAKASKQIMKPVLVYFYENTHITRADMKKIIILLAITVFMVTGCASQSSEENSNEKVENTAFETSQGTVEIENRSILSDEIEIMLPMEFGEMSEEAAKEKYPAEERPTLIYTNDDGSVNVAFSYTANACKEEDIPQYFNVLKENMQKTITVKEWYSDSVENQNGIKIAKLEFLTPAVDTDIYNLMYLVSLDDRLLICSFNSTKELMDEWKPIGEAIMGSIKKK